MNENYKSEKNCGLSNGVIVCSILIVLFIFAALFFSSSSNTSNSTVKITPSVKSQDQVLPETDNLPEWERRLNWAQAYRDCTNKKVAEYRALGFEVYFLSDLPKEQADSTRLTCNYEADYISGIDDEP